MRQQNSITLLILAVLAAPIGCSSDSKVSSAEAGQTSQVDSDNNTDDDRKKGGKRRNPTNPVRIDAKPNVFTMALAVVADNFDLALEKVHDGTGWMLGKAEVSFERYGSLGDGNQKTANYRIYVTDGDESFETEVEGIACDEFGIPTEDSQLKLDEAVQKIKSMLAKLQG